MICGDGHIIDSLMMYCMMLDSLMMYCMMLDASDNAGQAWYYFANGNVLLIVQVFSLVVFSVMLVQVSSYTVDSFYFFPLFCSPLYIRHYICR